MPAWVFVLWQNNAYGLVLYQSAMTMQGRKISPYFQIWMLH